MSIHLEPQKHEDYADILALSVALITYNRVFSRARGHVTSDSQIQQLLCRQARSVKDPPLRSIQAISLMVMASPYNHDNKFRTSLLCLSNSVRSYLHSPSYQVLGGIADTVAQSLTAIRSKSRRLRNTPYKDISDGIEMPEYPDEKSPYATEFMIPPLRSAPPPSFDFERLTRFMAYGFIISPIQFHWFGFLSRTFPFTKGNMTLPTFQRVCFDQLIFAPFGESTLRSIVIMHMGPCLR